MLKFVIAGFLGLAIAAGLGVAGYQAGFFDSFKQIAEDANKTPSAEPTSAGTTKGSETPTADAAPAEQANVPDILPTFDIVRIEPTGDAVVAGLSAPKATVALVANGAVIGKTIANTSGEWAIVLTTPLAPGDYDVAIHAAADDGKTVESTQRVTVSIPKSQDDEVLVVMNAEGEASTILQKPVAEAASGELTVAQVDEQKTDSNTRATAALQEEVVQENPADTAPASDAAAVVAGGSDTPAANAASTQMADKPTTDAVADASSDAQGSASQPDVAVVAEAAKVAETVVAQIPAAETKAAPESQSDTLTPVETPAANVAVNTTTTTAGAPSAETKTAVVAEAAAPKDASAGSETVVAAITDGDAATTETKAGTDVVATAVETATTTEPEVSATSNATVTVEAVETEKGRLFVAGTSDPRSSVRIYVGDDHVGDVTANAEGRWLLEARQTLAVGQHNVRADQVKRGDGTVVARAAVTFEREPDDIILRQVTATGDASGSGSAGSTGSASVTQLPNVIIRRGDNLWRISQRLYGEGLRYTTIYQANKEQIQNPDLIFPGQVFLTPQADANWSGDNAPTAPVN